MSNFNRIKFELLINKWRDPRNTTDVNKLKLLADETIQTINSDPFMKNVCDVFLYAISAKAINDPSFNKMQGLGESNIHDARK